MKKGRHKDNKIMAIVDMAPFGRQKKLNSILKILVYIVVF